jgi:caffeoyl-CoA O-methyltransferase
MDLIPDALYQYAEEYTNAESDLLRNINRETHLHVLRPRMISGHLQGRLLAMLSKMINPKFILEIGTYTGYSALCLAEGLQETGKIITIEKNEELKSQVDGYIQNSPFRGKIDNMIGEAQTIIPNLNYSWDMVFIDADKENYALYFDQTIDQVNPGGYIIADNVLWSGKVFDDQQNDKVTNVIRDFNKKVHEDPRVENVLLPIRDGLMILRKND